MLQTSDLFRLQEHGRFWNSEVSLDKEQQALKNANFSFKKLLTFPEKVGEKPVKRKELKGPWFWNIPPRILLGAMSHHPGNSAGERAVVQGAECRAWGDATL